MNTSSGVRRDRSRSPVQQRRSAHERLNNGSNSETTGGAKKAWVKVGDQQPSSSVKDRIGKRPVKERIELPSVSERLGSRPMSERIELDRRPAPKSRQHNTSFESPERRRPRNNDSSSFRGRGGRGGGGRRDNNSNRGPLDQDKLDAEMDDYMKKSKSGLDSMLDDYMNKGAKKSSTVPEQKVEVKTNGNDAAPANTDNTATASA